MTRTAYVSLQVGLERGWSGAVSNLPVQPLLLLFGLASLSCLKSLLSPYRSFVCKETFLLLDCV